ncbi:hypothetical protein LBMAG42_48530 [Deltaproteobacteria bacterium]|nr:hypothetical protein LBMAG42_48530 [Deltaproteobacteria bacterium]
MSFVKPLLAFVIAALVAAAAVACDDSSGSDSGTNACVEV